MSTFTIDSENNIAAHAEVPAGSENRNSFETERELAKLAGEWPGSRLVEVWNSFAGVAPFTDLKPVKEIHQLEGSRCADLADARASVPGRHATGGRRGACQGEGEKSPTKAPRRARAQKGADESRSNKKAEVIAMMKRAKGVTLAEIVEVTGWQKHTVRGFVSILGSKGGLTIESSKNAAGERSYRIAK